MTIEIVDLPMNSMVDLSSSLCKRFPEGSYKWAIYTMAMSNNHRVNQQVTIEIVDFPIINVNVYQRVITMFPTFPYNFYGLFGVPISPTEIHPFLSQVSVAFQVFAPVPWPFQKMDSL